MKNLIIAALLSLLTVTSAQAELYDMLYDRRSAKITNHDLAMNFYRFMFLGSLGAHRAAFIWHHKDAYKKDCAPSSQEIDQIIKSVIQVAQSDELVNDSVEMAAQVDRFCVDQTGFSMLYPKINGPAEK